MQWIHASALVALVALPVAAGAFVVACGSTESESTDCISNCDTSNGCTDATQVDCTSVCALAATLNTASGCGDPYNAEQVCVAMQSDACTSASTACSKELEAYQSCITAFCAQQPTPPSCDNAM